MTMVFYIWFLASLIVAAAGPSFLTLAPIPTPRRGSVGGILDNEEGIPEVWVVGGSNSEIKGKDVGKSVEVYNTASDKWREEDPMPISRSDHGAAPVLSKLYVAGGMSSCLHPQGGNICNISDVSVYDSIEKTWSEVAPMQIARRGLALAGDDESGLLYALGGMDCMDNCYGLPVAYLTTAEVYDVKTNTWEFLPPMNVGRRDLGAAIVQGKLYAVGGCGGDGSELDYKHCEASNTVEMYDPMIKTWTLMNPLLVPRHGFATGIYGDSQMIIAGGSSANGIDATDAKTNLTVTVDSYDSLNDGWYSIASMPDPRDGLMKGYGLITGTTMFLVSGSTADADYVDTNEIITLRC